MSKKEGALTIKDPEVIWSNFEGIESAYNMAGARHFVIRVPEEHLERANELGFSLKTRYEGEVADLLKIRIENNTFRYLFWFYPGESITITPKPWAWRPGGEDSPLVYEGIMAVLTDIEKES